MGWFQILVLRGGRACGVQDLLCLPHPPAKLVLGNAHVLLYYTVKAFPVLAVHPPPHPL